MSLSYIAMVAATVLASSCSSINVQLIVPRGSLVANSLKDLHSTSPQTSIRFYSVYYGESGVNGGNRSTA
jgi:hypothetical protein